METKKPRTQQEINVIPIGTGSFGILIPKYFRDYLGIDNGDKIVIMDDTNKRGQRFVSFYKKGE